MTSRPCVLIGNWKMHKTVEEARAFIEQLLDSIHSSDTTCIGLAVPFTVIYPLAEQVKGKAILIGAQNMNDASEGAFTGEIAGSMLKNAGAQFVLLGHSERRHLYHEDDALINRKLKQALHVGLQPILCIGETQKEYAEKRTAEVIQRQLTEGLKELSIEQMKQVMIAYEPVWAIGNGHSAAPFTAQEMLSVCRKTIASFASEEVSQQIAMLYGGSVTPSNAHDLLEQPDIDGLLIGGASLSLESFLAIVNDRYAKIRASQGEMS